MSFMEKCSNRATPVKLGLIICAPRAKLTLSVVVFERTNRCLGNLHYCRRKKSHLITNQSGQGECLMLFSSRVCPAAPLSECILSLTQSLGPSWCPVLLNPDPFLLCALRWWWMRCLWKQWLIICIVPQVGPCGACSTCMGTDNYFFGSDRACRREGCVTVSV